MPASEPQKLGDFTLIEKIGSGAMGTVYKAHQSSLHRIVALKLLPAHAASDPDFLARFKHEAKAAASLNHTNVVQIYAAGDDDGTHYFAMEYVEGESLGARLQRKGRVEPREALAVAHYVAQALDYAWRKARIIHRDIKPDNIFLSREGTVKLGDLGLAKVLGDQAAGLTQTGTTMGTPYYVSPEQALATREIDFRADIYSLGCTIYHAISGLPPYHGASAMSVLLQHISQPPPRIQSVYPECPLPIVGLLDRMLRKKPEERHESYEALLASLQTVIQRLREPAAAGVSMVVATPASARARSSGAAVAQPVRKRSWTPLVFLGLVAALAGAAFVWPVWKENSSTMTEVEPASVPPASVSSDPPSAIVGPLAAAPVPLPVTPPPATPALASNGPAPAIPPIAMTPIPATPRPATPAAIPIPTNQPDPEGFISLLDDGHIGAWKYFGQGGFSYQDGVATSQLNTPKGGHWWYTERPFADFLLRLEFRIINPLGNSGVYVRAPNSRDGGQCYQIDVSEEPNPLEMTGAICFIKAPIAVPKQSLRGWNELEIEAIGHHYLVKLNGVLVNDFTGSWRTSGYLGLQQARVGGVQFRNLRIKEL